MQEPEKQIGIVDAQYVAHHRGFTLGNPGNETLDGSRRKVRQRASLEFGMFMLVICLRAHHHNTV